MSSDEEEISPLDDVVLAQPEARGFAPDQMVACDDCLRANPPTRMKCLYCGAALPLNEGTANLRRPTLRRLEEGEQGFNVVLMPDAGAAIVTEELLAEAASLLHWETEQIKEILRADVPLPLARAASLDEAKLIQERLGSMNFHVKIISDETLAVESLPPKRMRRLELAEHKLTGWTGAGGESQSLAWSDIVLFVAGRLYTKRTEVEERSGRWGAESEIVAAREFYTDEAVLDIYTVNHDGGWRITTDSFDFSCLGERKGLIAGENFARLRELLQERAPAADNDLSYWRWHRLLTIAWPLVRHTESRGLRRQRPGRFNTEALTTLNNETQFTRYGRLRYHLKMRQRLPHT